VPEMAVDDCYDITCSVPEVRLELRVPLLAQPVVVAAGTNVEMGPDGESGPLGGDRFGQVVEQ